MIVTYFAPRNPLPDQSLPERRYAEEHCKQTTPTSISDLDLPALMAACQAAACVGRKGDAGYIIGGDCSTTRKEGGPSPVALIDQDESGSEPDWAALDEYEGFAWTTASHRPDKPSWRVVIPFVEPIAHGKLRPAFRGSFIRNRTQPAFLPTHGTDVTQVQWRVLRGTKRLDAVAMGAVEQAFESRDASVLGAAFEAAGMVLGEQSGGLIVRCPWVHLHSDGEAGGTVVLHADPDNRGYGKFYCSRTECLKAGRSSFDAMNAIRNIPAVAEELRHWPDPGLEGYARVDVPPAPLTAAPAGWSVMAGSLMGAPQSVERALKAWRAQHVKRDPGTTPELANSSAVVKWLVNAKGLSADRVGAELGEEAAAFARTLTSTDPTVQNVGRLTRIDQCLMAHELRWNEMALTVEIDGEPWTDNHTAAVRLALEQSGASDPEKPTPNGDIEQRSRAVATPYHPVLEYLTALPPWDGVPRVDRLWVEYFGAADTELNRKLGACFALGAVRRVLEPGTKVDMMPILLGGQGDFKSSGLAALVGGPPFFTDAAPGFGHRSENAMTLAGCWVWEIAEMQGMDRADLNAVKAFVTRSEDDVLLPYARAKTRLRRRSVLIGTTNDDQCLTDPTGSRRHPVIPIASIDRAGMVRDRDAFWAEALHRVRAGEQHWLEKGDELAMGERNLQYTRRDEGTIGALVAWFNRPAHTRGVSGDTFTVADAVQYALGGRTDGGSAVRVGHALKALGIEHRRVGRSKIRVYEFPPSEAQIGGCTDSTQPQPAPSTGTGTPDRT